MESLYEGIPLEDYLTQKRKWPKSGKYISGSYSESSIILYQAYSPKIADPALTHSNFITNNPQFDPKRMTWIKPNFLWMMFRSDWGRKPNQEKILAFEVSLPWFHSILAEAKLSGKDRNCRSSSVVVQWDPDHSPSGSKNSLRRDIQIGIRRNRAEEWSQGTSGPAILRIIDMTALVHNALATLPEGNFMMPLERIYDFASPNIDLINL